MKRSEMLKIIEDTLEEITGVDPETGDTLYPPHEYISYCILKDIEEAGMLPPLREKIENDRFVGYSTTLHPSWEEK